MKWIQLYQEIYIDPQIAIIFMESYEYVLSGLRAKFHIYFWS